MPRPTDVPEQDSQVYLPDFCAAGTVLIVLLVAELIAILLTLAEHTLPGTFLTELAKMSMYVLWLALLSAAVLCRARTWLEKSGTVRAFILGFVILEGLCLLLAEITFQVTNIFGEAAIISDSHAAFLLRTCAIS